MGSFNDRGLPYFILNFVILPPSQILWTLESCSEITKKIPQKAFFDLELKRVQYGFVKKFILYTGKIISGLHHINHASQILFGASCR
jgi:hypothetical protein